MSTAPGGGGGARVAPAAAAPSAPTRRALQPPLPPLLPLPCDAHDPGAAILTIGDIAFGAAGADEMMWVRRWYVDWTPEQRRESAARAAAAVEARQQGRRR